MESRNQVDLSQIIRPQVYVLQSFGIWFFPSYSLTSMRYWLYVLWGFIISVSVFVVPTASQMLYVTRLMASGDWDIQEVSGIINLLFGELITSLSLLNLWIRRDLLRELLDHALSEELQSMIISNRIVFIKTMKQAKIIYMICMTFVFINIVVHIVVTPMLRGFDMLPLKMDFIFIHNSELNKPEIFSYIYAYQIMYKFILIPTFTTLTTLFWSFLMYAIAHLDVLNQKIENIKKLTVTERKTSNCDEDTAFKRVFKQCLLHHQEIKRYIKNVEFAFEGFLLLTVVCSGCIICTNCIQILSIDDPIKNISAIIWIFVYMFAISSFLYVECNLAEEITKKGFQLSYAFFSSPWLTLRNDTKKDLLMFMVQTQKPLLIVSYKLIPISMRTFNIVMEWAYKGFAVMNQMRK